MGAMMSTTYTLGCLNEETHSWNNMVLYLREVCGLDDHQALSVMRYWVGGSILRKRRGRWEIRSGAYMDKENVRIALEEATAPEFTYNYTEGAD